MANKQLPNMNAIHVDIEDNVITLTAEDHESAVRFLAAFVALFKMIAGEDHIMSYDETETPS